MIAGVWAHAVWVHADSFKPRLYQLKCKDVQDVTKEAVAYSLLGAYNPITTHACFKGDHFKYFSPGAGHPEGDVIDYHKIIQFKKGRDHYEIKKLRKEGREYRIDVSFTVDGKQFMTTYDYVPDPEYTGRTGICGFVTNPHARDRACGLYR